MAKRATSTVYGRDVNLLNLVDKAKLKAVRTVPKPMREPTDAEREMSDALWASFYRPSRPTYRMLGGHIKFVGRVKHLCVGDMIDKPVVKAVETEMHRQGIGELWGTRLADELVETARASLVKHDGPYDARTPQEAARYVVDALIEAGKHEGASADELIAHAVRHRW